MTTLQTRPIAIVFPTSWYGRLRVVRHPARQGEDRCRFQIEKETYDAMGAPCWVEILDLFASETSNVEVTAHLLRSLMEGIFARHEAPP